MAMNADHGQQDDANVTLVIDEHGVIVELEGPIETLLGRSADAFLDRAALKWIHPDDIAATTAIVLAVAGSRDVSVSFRCRLGDSVQGWTPVRCEIEPCDPPGSVTIYLSPSRSFPEPAALTPIVAVPPIEINPLVDLIDDPLADLLLLTADTEATLVSPAVGQTFDVKTGEFFSAFVELLHPDDASQMIDLINQLANPEQRFAETTVRAMRTTGTWGKFRIRTRDLSQDPDFRCFFSVIHELTETEATNAPGSVDPRIREALSLASDPIMLIAADGRIRFATSSTSALIGRNAPDAIAKFLVDLLTPDSVTDYEAWRVNPETTACRLRFASTTGPPRWVSIRTVDAGAGSVGPNDAPYRVIALRDIDDLVTAEQTLARREAHFAALVKNSTAGVVVLDDTNRIIEAGHALEQVLGFRSDLVAGIALSAWVHPSDRARIIDTLHRARTTTRPVSTTVSQRVADGSWRFIHWTVQDYRSNPEIGGLVVNLDDRTDEFRARDELEISERRFRAIVDHSFEVTVIADATFTILWASPSISELLGWDANVVAGNAIIDFVHPDDIEQVLIRFERALTDDGPEPSIPVRVRTSIGTWRHVVVVAADRRDDPDISGVILNVRDAEDQVANERALAESEARYRMLVQNSTDVVAILTTDATVQWVSPAIQNVLGWKPNDVIGQAMGGIDDFSGREDLLDTFFTVADTPGSTDRMIAPFQHADGTWRWVDLVLTNRVDEPGIQGVVASYRDITERIEADRSRQASEERFRSLAESSPLGIFQLDRDSKCTYVNDRWCELTGRSADDTLGDGWREPFLRKGTEIDSFESNGTAFARIDPGIAIIRPDGSTRWCTLHIAPLTDDQGTHVGSVGTIDDITSTVDARHEANRLSLILESTPDLVLVITPAGDLVYVNEAARQFFLIGPDDPIGSNTVFDIFDTANLEYWTTSIVPELESGKVWQGEIEIANRTGKSLPVSAVANVHRDTSGRAEVISITARDMTERAELETRLEHQATHDPLTGLPNRALLVDRLSVALARLGRRGGFVTVLFVDLDRFKVVNDGLGHATGDELLQLVAHRIEATLRPDDTVARFGGDEFVIICEDLIDEAEAEHIAQRISTAISEPAVIGSSEVVVSVSIGISSVTDANEDPDQVIRDADAAMYVAKQNGRARWEIFDLELRSRATNRLTIEGELRRALQLDQFELLYQPVVDIATSRVVGAEALLRWRHPVRGTLTPADFLDVAEDTGLILPIGDWVLAQSCEQMRPWLAVPGSFRVSVNLSARQIDDTGLVSRVDEIIATSKIQPEQLILEITEGTLMRDATQSRATLAGIRQLGVGLAVDDFGTGYSSLAYLQRYPVDVLKIDRSFVSGLGHQDGDEAIVEAIISLAQALDLATTAEGVETEAQLDILRRLGCAYIQGFWFARPLGLMEFGQYVESQNA